MVNVTFPDGSVRSVPSRTKALPSKEIGGPGPTFIEAPIDDDEWEYFSFIGGWRARTKN